MRFAAVALASCVLAGPAVADYRMELSGTGMEDYYCRITVALRNETSSPLAEINGHFYSFVGEDNVGRSRGASFLNAAPGDRVEASFLTPNAPCDQVTGYQFVIGGCRLEGPFVDPGVCADRIVPIEPIVEAVPR
ncbi:MAG: hypothetical protein AAF637_22580 [Pseudomonadota bacterium]